LLPSAGYGTIKLKETRLYDNEKEIDLMLCHVLNFVKNLKAKMFISV